MPPEARELMREHNNNGRNHLDINPEWQAAINAIESGESVFVTGAAGTGKSTPLRYIRDRMKSHYALK
jgi:hypothetical protein